MYPGSVCSLESSASRHDVNLPVILPPHIQLRLLLFVLSLCSGATDTFEFSSKHLGEIAGISIGHITKEGKKVKGEAFWHVMEVVVTEKELGNK